MDNTVMEWFAGQLDRFARFGVITHFHLSTGLDPHECEVENILAFGDVPIRNKNLNPFKIREYFLEPATKQVVGTGRSPQEFLKIYYVVILSTVFRSEEVFPPSAITFQPNRWKPYEGRSKFQIDCVRGQENLVHNLLLPVMEMLRIICGVCELLNTPYRAFSTRGGGGDNTRICLLFTMEVLPAPDLIYDGVLTPLYNALRGHGIRRVMIGSLRLMNDKSDRLHLIKTKGNLSFTNEPSIINQLGEMVAPAKNCVLCYLAPGVMRGDFIDSMADYNTLSPLDDRIRELRIAGDGTIAGRRAWYEDELREITSSSAVYPQVAEAGPGDIHIRLSRESLVSASEFRWLIEHFMYEAHQELNRCGFQCGENISGDNQVEGRKFQWLYPRSFEGVDPFPEILVLFDELSLARIFFYKLQGWVIPNRDRRYLQVYMINSLFRQELQSVERVADIARLKNDDTFSPNTIRPLIPAITNAEYNMIVDRNHQLPIDHDMGGVDDMDI